MSAVVRSESKPDHTLWDEPHHERGHVVICTCGWMKAHPRQKVRDAAAAKHASRFSSSPGATP